MVSAKKMWLASFSLFAFLGCGASPQEPSKEKKPAAQPDDHEHKAGEGEHTHGETHAKAGEDHAHEPPHGGLVATANDKHIELKITKDGHIDIFVLDGDTKPISSKEAQGKVKLTLPDGVKEFPLSYDEKGDHLTAQSSVIVAEKVIALVELTIAGKPYSARFDYLFGSK